MYTSKGHSYIIIRKVFLTFLSMHPIAELRVIRPDFKVFLYSQDLYSCVTDSVESYSTGEITAPCRAF
jgi:hypothetical protein